VLRQLLDLARENAELKLELQKVRAELMIVQDMLGGLLERLGRIRPSPLDPPDDR